MKETELEEIAESVDYYFDISGEYESIYNVIHALDSFGLLDEEAAREFLERKENE